MHLNVLFSQVDMRVCSKTWTMVNTRLEELLTFLNTDQPETPLILCSLKGLGLILHLTARSSSPTR